MSDYIFKRMAYVRQYLAIWQSADRSTSKLVMVQPQNLREKKYQYCNESRSGASRKHQNRLWPGLLPGPRWRSSRRSPRPSRLGTGIPLPIPNPTSILLSSTIDTRALDTVNFPSSYPLAYRISSPDIGYVLQ